jgi:choline dehydrogenase-like flavoprotein
MTILCHLTTLPIESNTLTLDPDIKDAWGLPAIRVTYKNHPDDLKTRASSPNAHWNCSKQREPSRCGPEAEEETNWVYLMGTCRMREDPSRSVVDKYHRAHDVPNLFLVDGSNFVSAGRNQPTCTIQALAYRAAHQIADAAKKREIPQPA